MSQLIERGATGLVVTCLLVFGLTTLAVVSPGARSTLGLVTAPAAAYRVGDQIDLPSNTFDSAPSTVLIFARGDCVDCQRALKKFAELVSAVHTRKDTDVLLVTGLTSQDATTKYGEMLGLAPVEVLSFDLSQSHVKVVPTLVVVDQTGRVRGMWTPAMVASASSLTSEVMGVATLRIQ